MSRIPSKQIVLDTDATLTNNSDILISSQKAIKKYVDDSTGSIVVSYKTTIIGDDTTTTFAVTHNLNTDDTLVQIVETGSNKETIGATISRPDTNNINVAFAVAPSTGENFRVLILQI
ncbi:MAG: hypothetical protein ACC656_09935 [Candidatus Heimdallarchaeota archaeon]